MNKESVKNHTNPIAGGRTILNSQPTNPKFVLTQVLCGANMEHKLKIFFFTFIFIGLTVLNNCSGSNDSGGSDDPSIKKYQDAQVDTPQSAILPAAYSPQVAMSNEAKAPRVFVAWIDGRRGEANIYFNCKRIGGSWQHLNDLRIDTGLNQSTQADEVALAISADGNIVHIVWSDRTQGREAIWYNRSINGGVSFEQPQCLSPHWPFPYFSSQPRLCCSKDGQIVYVAYRYGKSDIAFRYSDTAGASWPNLTNDQFFAQSYFRGFNVSRDPSIACTDDGTYCHIAWQGGYWDDPTNCILYRGWDYSAGEWGTDAEKEANEFINWFCRPQIVCPATGKSAYIVCRLEGAYGNNEIILFTVNDLGTNLPVLEENISDFTNHDSFYPKGYYDNSTGKVCVVWDKFVHTATTTDQWQVKARSGVPGGTWADIQNLSEIATKNNKHYVLPAIGGIDSNIVVAWVGFHNPPNQYIYANTSDDSGATWEDITALVPISTPGTASVIYANRPQIAVNSNNQVYAVWEEKRGGNVIRIYGRDLSTPGNEETICHSTAQIPHAWQPQISASNNQVYAIWLSDRNGGFDVYFNRSQDYGNSWAKDFIVNQTAGEICKNLQLQSDPNNHVYVVWEKERTAPSDVISTPGHRIGDKINQVAFQHYVYGSKATNFHQAPPYILSSLPASSSPHHRVFPASQRIPRIGLNIYTPRSGISKAQIKNEQRIDIGINDNGTMPLLAHNNNGAVYIFYDNSEDHYQCQLQPYISRNYGNTGSWTPKDTQSFTNGEEMLNSQILAESDFLYLVTQIRYGANADIAFLRYSKYLDSVDLVMPNIDDNDLNPYTDNSQNPVICKDRNRLLVAWTDFRDGSKPDIYFTYSLNNGGFWADPAQDLSQDTADLEAHGRVQLASSPEFFYAVWNQYNEVSKTFKVMFRRIYIDVDGNVALDNKIQLNTRGNALEPKMICKDNRIIVAWRDNRYGTNDIWIRTSTDKGRTWSSEQRFNTNTINTTQTMMPQISTSGNWIYAIWEDYRTGRNVFFEARK